MSVFTKLPAGLLLAVLAGTVLMAQQDKPGSADHPLLSRLPDYFIHNYRECEFDAYEFRSGSIRETVEGKKTTISYRAKNNATPASDLQILRNYQNAIQRIGGETPYESRTRITLKLAKDGAETWVGVRTSNQGGMYTVYIVEKGPMEQKVAVGGASGTVAPTPDPRDARDSLDHPLFSRFPGYYIHAYRQSGFDAEQFRAGSIRETVEGKKTTITYNVKSDVHPASELQILRNYENAVKQAGGEAVYESAHERTLKLAQTGAENWLGIRTSNQGSMYTLTIVEKEAMEQLVTAQDMLQKLNTEGRVTLYIHFDTDKADIKPESEPVVDEILSALTTDPTLRLSIEGHTDNVGAAAYNQDLSARRAQSVVAALTEKGIAPDRLSAAGFGLEKPIADNSTDEGKAKNRRVELVKQ